MNITINGESRSAEDKATLADVLDTYGVAGRGVAVALDGAVVPRAEWPRTIVAAGAAIEVLTAVQGG